MFGDFVYMVYVYAWHVFYCVCVCVYVLIVLRWQCCRQLCICILYLHNVWGADGKREFISWFEHFWDTKEMLLCFVKYIIRITNKPTDFQEHSENSFCDRYFCPKKKKEVNIQKNRVPLTNFFVFIYRKMREKCLCVYERAYWWMHYVLHEQNVGVRISWIRYPFLRSDSPFSPEIKSKLGL